MQRKRLQNLERIIDMKQYMVEITNEALADMDQLYNPKYPPEDHIQSWSLCTFSRYKQSDYGQ